MKEENAISETDTPWRHVILTNLQFYIFCLSNFEGFESFLVSKFHRCPFWDGRFRDPRWWKIYYTHAGSNQQPQPAHSCKQNIIPITPINFTIPIPLIIYDQTHRKKDGIILIMSYHSLKWWSWQCHITVTIKSHYVIWTITGCCLP